MNILFIGDIVGEPGRRAIKELLHKIISEEALDLVIANGENAAGGSGITPSLLEELTMYGVDVVTSGDHIWKRKEIVDAIDSEEKLLRPVNYPDSAPGRGSGVFKTKNGISVGVINVIGRVFMEAVDSPFRKVMTEVEKLRKDTKIIVVDIHAEATSEKIAMGWYLDGLVSAIFGTHTHIQTADERILPKGTAYITDVGMTGPYDSVIGRKKEQVLARFITQMPIRFEMAEDDIHLHGAVVKIDESSGRAVSIKRINRALV